jgi:hypothetical protein
LTRLIAGPDKFWLVFLDSITLALLLWLHNLATSLAGRQEWPLLARFGPSCCHISCRQAKVQDKKIAAKGQYSKYQHFK